MPINRNVKHGTRVVVKFASEWFRGTVVENINDNERLIVVRTDKRAHFGPFLDGHGLSIGHRSDAIRRVK